MLEPRAARAACLAVVALLLGASPALANTYSVPTAGPDGTGSCSTVVAGQSTCTTLRAAVAAANANTGGDAITIGAGAFPTATNPLTLSGDTSISGLSARDTSVAPSNIRGFIVNSGVTVSMSNLTISGGTATTVTGDGGDIINGGNLTLNFVRLTGGNAIRGGGIANEAGGTPATLTLFETLIDHNTASVGSGGIANVGQTAAANLALTSSTVAFNTGTGGISSDVNASVTLTESTVARNTGTGLAVTAGSVRAQGSILAYNTTNCTGTVPQDLGGNIEDASSCHFAGSGKDPGLSAALVTDGGQTDVLALPAGSPAIDVAGQCGVALDQRSVTRPQGPACDAGAYEFVPPAPPPPVTTPTPTPTTTATPAPTPTPGKTVVAARVSGKVLVKKPGAKRFAAVDAAEGIPLGSTVDTTHGTVRITAKAGQVAEFFDGQFKVTQTKTTTDLTLNQALAPCGKGAHAAAAAKKPKTRKLWGNGTGSFRTRGQYSAATVRGTEWLVQDSCSGTLTRVKHGVVSVRDEVKRKTVILRAPHRYTARPKKKR